MMMASCCGRMGRDDARGGRLTSSQTLPQWRGRGGERAHKPEDARPPALAPFAVLVLMGPWRA
jgi:hypothetical protein